MQQVMTMIRRNVLWIAGAAALAVLAVPQMASAHVSVGIGFGVPVAPVYVAPAPVYYPPPPPVYYAPPRPRCTTPRRPCITVRPLMARRRLWWALAGTVGDRAIAGTTAVTGATGGKRHAGQEKGSFGSFFFGGTYTPWHGICVCLDDGYARNQPRDKAPRCRTGGSLTWSL